MAEESSYAESINYMNYLTSGRHVPMIETDDGTFVYFTDDIEAPSAYNLVIHALYTSTGEKPFFFIMNNGGGVVETAIMIADAMKVSAAQVHVRVTGLAASATTIIALSADELEIADHSSWLIHNYSGTSQGKGGELRSRQEFMDSSLKKAFASFYGGFLTQDEINKAIEDKDYWMGPEEVRSRWEKRKQFLEEQNG